MADHEHMSTEARRDVLTQLIAIAVEDGWRVEEKADTSATVTRQKKLGWGRLEDDRMYIEVRPTGRVIRKRSRASTK